MISLSQLSSHHAHLIVHEERKTISDSLWEEINVQSFANSFFESTVFDIDSARSLSIWALTPHGDKKVALVSFHTITIPAQNALLKILEEPPVGVMFILVTSNKEALLPTLLSRLQVSLSPSDKENSFAALAATFLATPPKERMKLGGIEELLAKTDEHMRKDRESLRKYILDIASLLRIKNKNMYIPEVMRILSYTNESSSSTKALLEYLSLYLPVIT